jgi:hypothetical protein
LKGGFEEKSISETSPKIKPNIQSYNDAVKAGSLKKYTIHDGFVVRTDNVELVEKSLNLAQLINKGIEAQSTVEYYCSDMDKLRVELVEEAAADSQNRAKQIARITGVKIVKLRNLSTGLFSIMAEDELAPREYYYDDGVHSIQKNVRVVVHGTFDIE